MLTRDRQRQQLLRAYLGLGLGLWVRVRARIRVRVRVRASTCFAYGATAAAAAWAAAASALRLALARALAALLLGRFRRSLSFGRSFRRSFSRLGDGGSLADVEAQPNQVNEPPSALPTPGSGGGEGLPLPQT